MFDLEVETARGAIETILRSHPDVSSAALVQEDAIDGRTYPVAYVVPHADRMRAARKQIASANQAKRVVQWQRTFDQVYRTKHVVPEPSFVGWTNSYTGTPLPMSEMQEWLDGTVARILSLLPESVLEIGCGVGLLVQAIGPKCGTYVGTDLSPIAIGRLKQFAGSRLDLRHVKLLQCEATDFHNKSAVAFDTVILNSVVQYFPDLDYLRRVIEQAKQNTSRGGRIFIGDVRHFGLLPAFHTAVQLAKSPSGASVGWLKRRAAFAVEQDRELAIDPAFFLSLSAEDPRVTSVDVLLKRGKTYNELTRYRYDVVIYLDGAEPVAPGVKFERAPSRHALADVAARLESGELASALISNVPNRRLSADLAILNGLHSADDRQTVAQFRDTLAGEADAGFDPEEFWALADRRLCNAWVSWTPDSPVGSFDVAYVAPSGANRVSSPCADSIRASLSRGLATDPMEAIYRQQLGMELQQFLSDRLPKALGATAVLAVSKLPTGTDSSSQEGPDPTFGRVGEGAHACR